MTCWAVIPVRPPGEGKARLAGALDDARRHALVEAMLGHVAATVTAAGHVKRTLLVGPMRPGLPATLGQIADPPAGLNPALQAALASFGGEAVSRLLVIPADLPQLTAQDIELLAAAPPGTLAIAPDRHGTGTNALSLPLPEAQGFRFAFGTDSFAAHHDEAARLGLKIETIHSHGLERDIDLPEDLPDAAHLMA